MFVVLLVFIANVCSTLIIPLTNGGTVSAVTTLTLTLTDTDRAAPLPCSSLLPRVWALSLSQWPRWRPCELTLDCQATHNQY
jgi:hypothetical protein